MNPSRVTARRCRLSYGVSMARLWTPADTRSQLLHGYLRRIVNPEDMRAYALGEWARYCFSTTAAGKLAGCVSVRVGRIGTSICALAESCQEASN